MTSKRFAALGLGLGLLAGTGAALVVNLPGGVGASSRPAVVTQDDGTTTDDPVTADDARPAPGDRLRDLLAPLVDDGTLTEEQVDAIIDQVQAHRPAGPHGGMPGRGGWRGHRGERLTTAAEVIGIDVEELRSALRGGQTIAEVAEANGVDPQAVIDALVDEAEARITTMVNEGPHRVADDPAEG
jgi:hypothetical protein